MDCQLYARFASEQQRALMPLTYRDRSTSGTQLDVLSGTVAVCSLWKAVLSTDTRGERWEWSWRISNGPPGFFPYGHADTKPEAQAVLESTWQAWLDAAGLNRS